MVKTINHPFGNGFNPYKNELGMVYFVKPHDLLFRCIRIFCTKPCIIHCIIWLEKDHHYIPHKMAFTVNNCHKIEQDQLSYLVAHPTARKWVVTPVINGIIRVNPLIIGVITHLLSGMNHQVSNL